MGKITKLIKSRIDQFKEYIFFKKVKDIKEDRFSIDGRLSERIYFGKNHRVLWTERNESKYVMVCSRNGDNRRIRKAKGYRLKYGEIFSKDWVKSEYKKREHEKRLEGAERASAMFTSAMAKTEARRYIKQHEKEKHED
tara:strand:+ start:239 stop:655 length:417 start_codon:yes stop_codon:yes gene_type:complete